MGIGGAVGIGLLQNEDDPGDRLGIKADGYLPGKADKAAVQKKENG
ncbi:hypothetical protein FACS1894169_04960 [Bacteroidia bacterium]|nr:hypothetical protein FACS1894169_04960 [Bacteroidia bacterium]